MEIVEITNKELKKQVVENVLRMLPQWFGIEESTREYINRSENEIVFSCKENEKYIGFVAVKENTNACIEIDSMGINPEYHRNGIGRKLVDKTIEYGRLNGKRLLEVKTLSSKHPDPYYKKTREFYKAVGFIELEEMDIWGPENPCLLLLQSLD